MLFANPNEHAANGPETWVVMKHGRKWELRPAGSPTVFNTFSTQKAAIAAKQSGFLFNLYVKEGRWFAGLPVDGWKPYIGEEGGAK